MENIRETRYKRGDGIYDISLEVRDSAYFNVFKTVDSDSGSAFLKEYLSGSADEAKYKNIDINYNRGRRIVNIKAKLDYNNIN